MRKLFSKFMKTYNQAGKFAEEKYKSKNNFNINILCKYCNHNVKKNF